MVVFIPLGGSWDAYIQLLCFLDEKGLSIVTQLHVQVYGLSIHFNVNLKEINTGFKPTPLC